MSVVLEVRKSSISGRGCFALVPFAKRKKIACFAGELILGKRAVAARLREHEACGIIKVVVFAPDAAIDGTVGGDATAYLNHSCQPNAYMRSVPGNKVVFFALRDIAIGEEITMDYRADAHPSSGVCKCGALGCHSSKGQR